VDPGTRPSTGSTPRCDHHPFLTTENALAYTKDPRMEGLHIAFDEEWPSEIQNLSFGVFLTPRERGASLQEEHMAAHYATKQLLFRTAEKSPCYSFPSNKLMHCSYTNPTVASP